MSRSYLGPREGIRGQEDVLIPEQLRILREALPRSLLSNAVLASLLVLVQWEMITPFLALAWLAVMLVVLLGRGLIYVAYGRVSPRQVLNPRQWLWRFRAGAIATGMVWALATIVMFPALDISHQAFHAFVIAGVSAGAIATLSVDRIASIGFVIPAVLILGVALLLEGTTMSLVMGGMVIIFLVFVLQSSAQLRKLFHNNLNLHEKADQERRRLALILENAEEGIYGVDLEGHTTFANPAAIRMLGYSQEDLLGKPKHELIHYAHADGTPYPLEECPIHAAIIKGQPTHTENDVFWHKDGTPVPVFYSSSPQFDELGNICGAIVIFRDITEYKEAQENLRQAASVFEHANEGIMITDAQGTILDVNDAFTRISGYSRDELLGQNPRIFKSGRQGREHYKRMFEELRQHGQWSGEVWDRRKDGTHYAALLTISMVKDDQGAIQRYISLFSDITLLKEHQSRLEHLAHYDPLTGLPNRSLLTDRLQQAIAQAQRRETLIAVVYLDLDGFKAVNDTHGHEMGDNLLKIIAGRMQETLRESDTLARIGGDEFVAVLIDLPNKEASSPILDRLLEVTSEPVHLDGHKLCVSASLGVSYFPQAELMEADQLLRQADQAMYAAKQAGKNRYHIFDTAGAATADSDML